MSVYQGKKVYYIEMELLHFLNPELLIKTFGLIGYFAIVFAESGLLFGFIFPGDSLLFTAGFLSPLLGINIWLLALGTIITAILGDSFGYYFGKKIGPAIFTKEDSFLFNKKYITRAELFFEKHGPRAIILARFIPAVRTFTPILAGAGNMNYKTFLTYNIIGGIIWGGSLTLLGYYLGSIIPDIDKYLLPIILIIIFLSFIPIFVTIIKSYKK